MQVAEPRRRKVGKSKPVQRTRDRLKELELVNEIVERRVPGVNRTQDLFNVIDILAVTDATTIGIQCSRGGDHATHRTKCEAEPLFWTWLRCESRRFVVWSWSKRGERGKRKLWTGRIEEASVVDDQPRIDWREISEAEL